MYITEFYKDKQHNLASQVRAYLPNCTRPV